MSAVPRQKSHGRNTFAMFNAKRRRRAADSIALNLKDTETRTERSSGDRPDGVVVGTITLPGQQF